MNTDTIREQVRRQPFVPFMLRLNDGRVFHIPHPEYIAVSKREVYVIDATTERGTFLEPVLIASLEPTDKPNPSVSNPATGGNNP